FIPLIIHYSLYRQMSTSYIYTLSLHDALPIFQKAMIDHFTKADEDYGRRVKEEMKKKIKEMEQQETKGEIGREAGPSKYGQGSMDANEATKEAVDKSQEADRY